MNQRVPERSEIPVEYTWDAASVFASDDDWAAAVNMVASRMEELAVYRGHLAEGPAILADYLTLAEALLRTTAQVGVYARMFYSVNTADAAAQARVDRATALSARLGAALAFGEPEMLAIGAERLRESTQTEPRLAHYAHHERVERGEALTADSLINLMADLFAEGYGDEVVMDRERVGATWMQFSTHLYANFYTYQYATGISGAHALAEGVLAGAPGAAERYLDFLKAGSSRYPLDILRHAGVDLASPESVQRAFAVLEGYVAQLETLV
jgi:oligoendopeptidase F